MASESHVDFCNYIKTHNVKMDIFITTYDTKYEKELKSWYPKCKYKSTKKLIQDAVNEIEGYDFIFLTRLDIFILYLIQSGKLYILCANIIRSGDAACLIRPLW